MANNVIDPSMESVNWANINWKRLEKQTRHLQERIFRVICQNKLRQARGLQRLLVKSYAARCLAIRTVTEINQGRWTPGIDNKIFSTDEDKTFLSQQPMFSKGYHASPVKRVYIPKRSGKLRPLGIPIMEDRIRQERDRLALESEWEAKFEPNSFGFRPNRCCQDAIQRITKELNWKVAWIFDADIQGCFDNISHEAILKRVPVFRNDIRKWLEAGAIDWGYQPTPTGTPQGGIISPLLSNIALDGLERCFGAQGATRWTWIPPRKRNGLNRDVCLVRYADDFVVLSPTKERIEQYIIPTLQRFLEARGLKFNEAKSRIVHISEGVDFLGFNIRHSPNKFLSVQPAKESVKRFLQDIKLVLDSNKQATTKEIITILNPKIVGWGNYYRYCQAEKAFGYIDSQIVKMLWYWCKRRHPKKNHRWIKQNYFTQENGNNWTLTAKTYTLKHMYSIPRKKYNWWVGWLTKYNPKWRVILRDRLKEVNAL